MEKINKLINDNLNKVILVMLAILLFRGCGSEIKPLNKRVDALNAKIDSLAKVTVTKKDLQIEGLKSEKRMIQSTDRKILDVNRQTEIDKEIDRITK